MKNLFFILVTIIHLNAQTQYRFNINNINMPLDNKGILGNVYGIPGGSGGYYNDVNFLFSGGFWLSGFSQDTLWTNGQATAALIQNYQPGKFGANQYDPRHKIYVVSKFDAPFGASWQEWLFAVELGANFYDGNNDGLYTPVDFNNNGQWDINEDRPDIIGDIVAWCVYNDGIFPRLRPEGSEPMGIEIRQTVFGYYPFSTQLLKDIIFIRYEILNTGLKNDLFDSVYFTAWADADLGSKYFDDFAGCDTILNSGFVYDSVHDSIFGETAHALFINLLQGAPNYIPGVTFTDINSNGIYDEDIDIPLDTARNLVGPLRGIEYFPGAINSNLSSFIRNARYDPQTWDPHSMTEMRRYMTGYNLEGAPIDPCIYSYGQVHGGVACSLVNPIYMFSGDPESNYGWLQTVITDLRLCVNTGPFQLKQNYPVSIIIGYTLGKGTSLSNAVTNGKLLTTIVNDFYKSNFDISLVPVRENYQTFPSDFKLFQNYPNPFNPSTRIQYQVSSSSQVTLKVYDVLGNEIVTLVNEYKPAGRYEVEFDASAGIPQSGRRHLASGIYLYQLRAGEYVQTKKMILLR